MRFLRIFKLTKIKRIVIFTLTTIFAVLAIILGSIFYNAPQTTLNPSFHTSSQYVFEIKSSETDIIKLKALTNKIAQDIKNRLDVDVNKDVQVEAEITNDNKGAVRVTYPYITDQTTQDQISKFVVDKPNLVVLDYYGNALFDKEGKFNSALKPGEDPGKAIINPEDVNWNTDSKIPMKRSGASYFYANKGNISIDLEDNGRQQWITATEYVSKLPENKRIIVAFLYLQEYIQKAKTDWESDWIASGKNPYFFSFVNNKPMDENNNQNILKSRQINAAHYLISYDVFSPTGMTPKTGPLNGDSFILQRSTSESNISDLRNIANQINYGSSDYSLSMLSSYFIAPTSGNNSFNSFLIAGIVIFVLLWIFLIFNYGIMGIIGSISTVLFAFLSWTFFVFLGGVFSPIIVGALIFMIGFFVDKLVTFFEKIQHDLYQGDSLAKTLKISGYKMTGIFFDTNVIGLIVGLGLFYFGAQMIWSFSLFLLIGFIISLFTAWFFTKGLILTFLNSGIFHNKKKWLGLKSKSSSYVSNFQQKLHNFDFVNKSPLITYSFLGVVCLAIIFIIIFAAINFSWMNTLHFDVILRGGSIFQISNIADQNQVDKILEVFNQNGIHIKEMVVGNNNLANIIIGQINRNLNLDAIKTQLDSIGSVNTYVATILNGQGHSLVIGALIGAIVSLIFISIYIIFRFRWTFALTILLTSLFDILLLISIFAIIRLYVDVEFIVGIVLVMIYAISNHIIQFSKIRQKTSVHVGELNHQSNIKIANETIQTSFKRLIIVSLMFILLTVILLSFTNIIAISLGVALIVGVIISAISTTFIGPSLWVKLETYRQKQIQERVKKQFWNVNNPEEQTFNGINDFKV